MLDAILVLEHEPALIVESGAEPALHRLANDDILLLDLIDEGDHRRRLRHPFLEVEVVDGQGPIRRDGENDVRRGVAASRVEIEHEVGPEIIVDSLLPTY